MIGCPAYDRRFPLSPPPESSEGRLAVTGEVENRSLIDRVWVILADVKLSLDPNGERAGLAYLVSVVLNGCLLDTTAGGSWNSSVGGPDGSE